MNKRVTRTRGSDKKFGISVTFTTRKKVFQEETIPMSVYRWVKKLLFLNTILLLGLGLKCVTVPQHYPFEN